MPNIEPLQITSYLPSILKELQCSGDIRMGLDFVEKDERIARNELFGWVDQGNIADDGIRAITVRSDCAIFRFLNRS